MEMVKKMYDKGSEERTLFTITTNYILSVEYSDKTVSTTLDPLQAKWCADQAENFTEYLENVKKYFIVED